MLPPSLLPQLYAQSSLPRLAHSALPDAPVQRPVAPRLLRASVAAVHVLRRVAPARLRRLARREPGRVAECQG